MIDKGTIADKAAQAQIGFDQRGRFQHRPFAINLVGRQQVHRLVHPRPRSQVWRGQVAVLQLRQWMREAIWIGAVKTGHAKQHLDPALRDIVRQPLPQMKHCRATPVVRMQT